MADCNVHCMKKFYIATYNKKKIVITNVQVDGAAPLAGDQAAVEADLRGKLEQKYKLQPGRTDMSQPVGVAGKQCPAADPKAAPPFLGCHCVMPANPPKYPDDYKYHDPHHPVSTTWKDNGGTNHTVTAEIDVAIAEQEGLCEANDPEKVAFAPPTQEYTVRADRSSKSPARSQGSKG